MGRIVVDGWQSNLPNMPPRNNSFAIQALSCSAHLISMLCVPTNKAQGCAELGRRQHQSTVHLGLWHNPVESCWWRHPLTARNTPERFSEEEWRLLNLLPYLAYWLSINSYSRFYINYRFSLYISVFRIMKFRVYYSLCVYTLSEVL